MDQERYAGEQRGLGLFLEELRPVVARELGARSMLAHAIAKALARQELRHLRHARDLFNTLPREQRQTLSAGIVAQPERKPERRHLLDHYGQREPQPFVCFESETEGPAQGRQQQIAMRHELMDGPALRVLVRPNTLPSTAVKALREIADMIEGDRRILSMRYWRAAQVREVSRHSDADFG